MALSGELSDLSLAELIEFFCNQRKTGQLEVTYPVGAGFFYLKSGTVIHARFGDLRGIDAVYYALTQPNASFNFSTGLEPPEQSINQPWMSVVLEGLRRMDEGVTPPKPSPSSLERPKVAVRPPAPAAVATKPAATRTQQPSVAAKKPADDVQAFGVLLSSSNSGPFARRRWNPAMVVAAVIALIAVVGVPWGWYRHKNGKISASDASAATPSTPVAQTTDASSNVQPETVAPQPEASPSIDPNEMAIRQHEARMREQRAKATEQRQETAAQAAKSAASSSNKRTTVTVTYDENGRVTAASGGDATALRIARQKRFPPGKPGSATITIPIN